MTDLGKLWEDVKNAAETASVGDWCGIIGFLGFGTMMILWVFIPLIKHGPGAKGGSGFR